MSEWGQLRAEGFLDSVVSKRSLFLSSHQISCDYVAVSPLKLNLCGNLWAADWNLPIPRQRWKLSLTKMTPRPWSSATKWFSPAEEHGGGPIFCTSIIMFQHDLFFWLPWKAISECVPRVFLTGRPSPAGLSVSVKNPSHLHLAPMAGDWSIANFWHVLNIFPV